MDSTDYCTVKNVIDFPVLSRDVTNQTLPGRKLLNYSLLERVWLVTSRLDTGKSLTLFTVYFLEKQEIVCYSNCTLVQCTNVPNWVSKVPVFACESFIIIGSGFKLQRTTEYSIQDVLKTADGFNHLDQKALRKNN